MVQSGIVLPEHLDVFETGIARRLDYSYSGPQGGRIARMLYGGQIELGAVHTYLENQVHEPMAGAILAEDQWKQFEREREEKLSSELAPLVEEFPDVRVKKVVTRDRPVRALVDQSKNAQLLITGSHGRGGFKGMLLGSTSRALLQAAPCPMMVVRPDRLPK